MPSLHRAPTKGSLETKERIFDAAEALFMDQGFSTTSLRAITAKAKVNLAAVNYHFGSKEGLIREVFDRSLGPLNRARMAQLDRLEAAAGGNPVMIDKIVEALVSPALHVSHDPLKRGAAFLRLLGRALSEPAEYMRAFLPAHYRDVVVRFKRALSLALPNLSEAELAWRLHFTFGAMAYSMAGTDAVELFTTPDDTGVDDAEAIVQRLIPFLVAGLKSPTPKARAARSVELGTRKVA